MYKVRLEILMGDLTRSGFPFMTEISLCLKWMFAKIKVLQYIFAVIILSSLRIILFQRGTKLPLKQDVSMKFPR